MISSEVTKVTKLFGVMFFCNVLISYFVKSLLIGRIFKMSLSSQLVSLKRFDTVTITLVPEEFLRISFTNELSCSFYSQFSVQKGTPFSGNFLVTFLRHLAPLLVV